MPFASALAKMPSGLALPLALLFLTPALVLLTLVRDPRDALPC